MNLDQGLLGYWALDEGPSASVVADSSGNGWSGTRLGNPASSPIVAPVGSSSRSLFLDGIGDCVYVPGIPREATPNWSYSFWFRPVADMDLGTARMDFIDGDGISRPHISFNREGDGAIGAYPNGVDTCLTSTSTWMEDVWYHVAVTFDDTHVVIYRDGTEERRVTHSGQLSSVGLYLGCDDGSANYFHGHLDEVRFYGRALSPAEVSALAAGG